MDLPTDQEKGGWEVQNKKDCMEFHVLQCKEQPKIGEAAPTLAAFELHFVPIKRLGF